MIFLVNFGGILSLQFGNDYHLLSDFWPNFQSSMTIFYCKLVGSKICHICKVLMTTLINFYIRNFSRKSDHIDIKYHMTLNIIFYFIDFGTQEVLDHVASFHQEERQLHGRESNRQSLCPVWVPFHYHPGNLESSRTNTIFSVTISI